MSRPAPPKDVRDIDPVYKVIPHVMKECWIMQNLQQMETNPDSSLLDMQYLHPKDGSPLSLGCQLRRSEEPSSILPIYFIYDGTNL